MTSPYRVAAPAAHPSFMERAVAGVYANVDDAIDDHVEAWHKDAEYMVVDGLQPVALHDFLRGGAQRGP